METMRKISAFIVAILLTAFGIYLMKIVWHIIWWQFFIVLIVYIIGIGFSIAAIEIE